MTLKYFFQQKNKITELNYDTKIRITGIPGLGPAIDIAAAPGTPDEDGGGCRKKDTKLFGYSGNPKIV